MNEEEKKNCKNLMRDAAGELHVWILRDLENVTEEYPDADSMWTIRRLKEIAERIRMAERLRSMAESIDETVE